MEAQQQQTRATLAATTAGKVNALAVLKTASVVLTTLIFLLISLGGLVRNAGAGLSCPDWPLCFGHVVPPMDEQVFLEWFHRLIAGSISVFLLGLSAFIFAKRELRRELGRYCVAAIGLLMMQIVLGGLTVLGLLDPKWVSSHLAVGLAFFSTVLVLTLKIQDLDAPRANPNLPPALRYGSIGAVLVLYMQILLGGLVSSNYAGLACADFPTCNGQWLPALEGLVRFQVFHRIGALLASIAVLSLVLVGLAARIPGRRARVALIALPMLLAIQIFLGVGSVFMKLPLPMSVAHLATATSMLGMLLVTTYEIRRSS